MSHNPEPIDPDRRTRRTGPAGRCRRIFVATALAGLTVAGAVTVPVGPSTAATTTTIATAPFTAPTGVALADTPPPWPIPTDARPYIAAAGLSVLTAEQLDVHYHVHLDVIANGRAVTVPAGIGFVVVNGQETGITVLHTHDTSGILHIESATPQPYTLGQLFTEWGVALDATRIGGLHADATHAVAAYVNGKRFTGDPATLSLARHQEIALWYGPTGTRPRVPKSYRFPAGL